MKLTESINQILGEEKIEKSMYKTMLRDGDRIFIREKKTGQKHSTLFVSSKNDSLVIRQGASNGDYLLELKKPNITVGDLIKALDAKPNNFNTKSLDMSLNESRIEEAKPKAFFGSAEGLNYAVNIDGVDNQFPTYPFGRQLDDLKKVKAFMASAKKSYADAKHKATMPAVKKHIKDQGYSQFYARWKKDTSMYKDDSVEIFYIK